MATSVVADFEDHQWADCGGAVGACRNKRCCCGRDSGLPPPPLPRDDVPHPWLLMKITYIQKRDLNTRIQFLYTCLY